ncbi:MAG: zinc-binding alcohol dehydrogenase [Chloroflexi bacterium AL-W]|nr:zinc-binding alcohol dehydrogenase [Chloroflexi bacterium AL-N1]NOK70569.1 zinc-binding alcohol dehydrogenase [Chloroflexi bacterium AL-N10]NOK77561.1 zinc-binding alcohol dehydrogenase [Chloroflexi bacterium AL-N5]NOK84412.1 zinc-binding alcohol dehydrogenase [Chloroflexi bacterium AL-W]NOK92301.1 zinc-binding alcohol dehydrogenase [Chloroflexi bacterium AL-N15]
MQRHSLLLTSPHQLTWFAEELPPPGPNDILVRTRMGAISVGTELPQYRGDARVSEPPRYPVMTGYENVAEVIDCGTEVQHIVTGDRIVAFYGHRTAAMLPHSRVIRVPDNIDDALALLVILACDTAKGVSKLNPASDDTVLVTGAGTIGLLTVFNLRAQRIDKIDVVDPLPQRRELALQFGARHAGALADMHLLSSAYTKGFECSSRNEAFALLQNKLKPGGSICILADGNVEPLTLQPAFHHKELTVVGSSDGLNYQDYAHWFWEHARPATSTLLDLFDLHTSVDHIPNTFARMVNREIYPTKVLIHYKF